MFEAARPTRTSGLFFNFLEVTYHTSVRLVRQQHGNAFWAIGMGVIQGVLFLIAFYFMFELLGTRTIAIRGNFMLYLLTGIYLYLVHIQAVTAITMAEGPTSAMMQHAPMNTMVAVFAAAISALYLKVMSLVVILLTIHVLIEPIELYDWAGSLMMFFLGWGSGVAIGMLLRAFKPYAPSLIPIVQMAYIRINMFASGKMFVANMMPSMMIQMFDWNPLFHIIDQMRGFVFVNYVPHNSNWQYPLYMTLGLALLGLIADFYTRKNASASWDAGR